ncbi:MAG: ABC transporter ATP-binding protein [Actinomyces sp. oral taxon 181]|uniref:ABC transporter ATP-binding protein n=1 Tax=Actinomyces sp. oral taxon 181 TaxID=712121 RepID=UPI0025C35E7B|nr:ABC transporter ATP-binding protein [Actinomyces sp. oral taxon 181]MBS4796653.1 ABC transporter ATP-binding protein [Actinomyces sp. oral taxon 181]
MFELISRLREPLSPEGRAGFSHVMYLSCIVGLVRGFSLISFIPAAIALTSGQPAWGMDLRGWLIALAVCAAASFILEYFLAIRSYVVAFDFLTNMHRAIGDKIASLPLGAFRADTAGKTSRLVSRELMMLGEIFAHMYSPLIAAIVTSLTMLAGITVFSPVLGVVCLVSVPIVAGGVWVARRCLLSGSALKEAPAQELSHRIVEYATKQGALRACGRSASYEPLQRAEELYGAAARRSLVRETLGQIVNGMAAQVVVVSLICAIGLLAVGGSVSPVEAVVAIGLLLRFTQILVDIGMLTSAFETRRPVLDLGHEILSAPELPTASEDGESDDSAELSASVALEDVVFSYEADQPVLQGVSFRVEPGTMTAIVGPSGCGKTTIARLIARFYDVDSGVVSVGDRDVRSWDTAKLMAQLSLVFQDVYLFDDTLEANVRVGRPDASAAEIEEAARLSGVDEIVARLPLGWDTPVGEGGRALSGGERQRVSIARALLKDSPIVLFDEATSALDPENEHRVTAAMDKLRRNATLIVIAHKLDTITAADQIVVLDENGRVVQIGTHTQLFAETEGQYRGFWEARSRAAGWRLV